jgi:hypothetical protein
LERSISAMLPTDTAALARGDPLPPAPHDPRHWVRDARIACVECGAGVPFVAIAADATDRSRLTDCAQCLNPERARWNLAARP